MPDAADLLASDRGSVIAPAGCGKTELIARAATLNKGRRLLILTHTNAGLRALKDRLHRLRVKPGSAHVDTIAGWALRYALAYPATSKQSNHDPLGGEWDSVYRGVADLLDVRGIRAVVQASYSRVLVDEYQDCSQVQHAPVCKLAATLPTWVLGDPLQGIFDFGDGLVAWRDVTSDFPQLGELTDPWRWKGKNEQLGAWCIGLRDALLKGEPIDLSQSRAAVAWRQLTNGAERAKAFSMLKLDGGVIVIRKWEAQAHQFARTMGGCYRSMEEVEGKALRAFARDMDALDGPLRAARIVELGADCHTGIKATLGAAKKAIDEGKVPTPRQATKHPAVVNALIAVCHDRSSAVAHAAMLAIESLPGCERFRSELWGTAKRVLKEHVTGKHDRVADSATAIRQQQRAAGRLPDRHLVSRTVLVKGLEFDHALVPNAEEFEGKQAGDGARHFYVAATRGSRTLSVLSANPVVKFSAPAI
ncbi:MAG TPA: UvrD-helicase domain-containing protein [Kofleriaceae bacterium]|jgi:DNA helicase-2/ATP-dependent DNA helicase PcrA|nr:UvrD-helicase domain-containing protein [Kofleriaceae bacterium]